MFTETDGPMRDMEGKMILINKIIMPFCHLNIGTQMQGLRPGMLKNYPGMNNGLKNTTEGSTGTL